MTDETNDRLAGPPTLGYLESCHHVIDDNNLRGLTAVLWAAAVDIVDALDRVGTRIGDAVDGHAEEMGRLSR